MKKLILFSTALFLLATGCVTDISQAARKARINTIQVEPRVKVDQSMRYGFDAQTGNLSVAIAGLIVNEMYARRVEQLRTNMEQNGINVPEIVRQNAAASLREYNFFTVVTNDADGVLVVAIKQHGFDKVGLSFSQESPFIVLRGGLIQRGKCIWSGSGYATPGTGGLSAQLEEYQAQPDLLRRHWEEQVDHALRQLLWPWKSNGW